MSMKPNPATVSDYFSTETRIDLALWFIKTLMLHHYDPSKMSAVSQYPNSSGICYIHCEDAKKVN